MNIIDSLAHDPRQVLGSAIAITGPRKHVKKLSKRLHGMFDRVIQLPCPSDHGAFPDTTGYTSKDWENLEVEGEDPTLYRYMQNCIDAITTFNDEIIRQYDKRGYRHLEGFIHAPKFGGTCWAMAGIVRGTSPLVL